MKNSLPCRLIILIINLSILLFTPQIVLAADRCNELILTIATPHYKLSNRNAVHCSHGDIFSLSIDDSQQVLDTEASITHGPDCKVTLTNKEDKNKTVTFEIQQAFCAVQGENIYYHPLSPAGLGFSGHITKGSFNPQRSGQIFFHAVVIN